MNINRQEYQTIFVFDSNERKIIEESGKLPNKLSFTFTPPGYSNQFAIPNSDTETISSLLTMIKDLNLTVVDN